MRLFANTEHTPPFTRNAVDRFELRCRDIGIPARMRIGHDGVGRELGWHLLHADVTYAHTYAYTHTRMRAHTDTHMQVCIYIHTHKRTHDGACTSHSRHMAQARVAGCSTVGVDVFGALSLWLAGCSSAATG